MFGFKEDAHLLFVVVLQLMGVPPSSIFFPSIHSLPLYNYGFGDNGAAARGVQTARGEPGASVRRWRPKDVLGVALDMDHRTVSYYLNGVDLGVARHQRAKWPTIGKYCPLVGYHKSNQWLAMANFTLAV